MVEPLQIDGTETCISSHLTATKKRPRSTTIYSEEEAYSARLISSVPRASEPQHMTVSTGIIMTRRDSYYPKPLLNPSRDQNKYSDTFATSRPNTSSGSTQYKSLRNSVHIPPTILEEHSVHPSPPPMTMMTPSPSLEIFSFAASDSIQSFIVNSIQEQDLSPTEQGPSREEDGKSLNPVATHSALKHHTLHNWNSMFHTIG